MELKDVLQELTEAWGISGFEEKAEDVTVKHLSTYSDEIKADGLGSVVALKRGEQTDGRRYKILLAAHLDQIGLMITKIEDGGFMHMTKIGGIDESILPGQRVHIMGKEIIDGVIGAKPPHLQESGESNKVISISDMYIDTGRSKEELEKMVEVGTLAKIESEFIELSNGCLAMQAMDDRAGVASLVETLRRLQIRRHQWDVYAVATAQEEVSGLGAMSTAFRIEPDLAIAIDVTFGDGPGIPEQRSYELGKGPAIGIGPNFHPKISKKLCDLASEYSIPNQSEYAPYPGGTDAYSLQVSQVGIPSGLLSIPLRNMHSTVELLKLVDIKNLAELLSVFISELDSAFLEDLKCF
ncbi:M20/M25/M40 family metallo-hydrolase [Candidatus Poribacteria bacterium]|nr:M20/M25/M40 family metallo-hydrolase [Candidatus Poribacteria bacterium]